MNSIIFVHAIILILVERDIHTSPVTFRRFPAIYLMFPPLILSSTCLASPPASNTNSKSSWRSLMISSTVFINCTRSNTFPLSTERSIEMFILLRSSAALKFIHLVICPQNGQSSTISSPWHTLRLKWYLYSHRYTMDCTSRTTSPQMREGLRHYTACAFDHAIDHPMAYLS